MLVVVGRDLRIARASDAFAQLLGTTAASLRYAPLDALVEGDVERLRAALGSGREQVVSLAIREADGVTRTRRFAVVPFPEAPACILQAEPPGEAVVQRRLEEVLDEVDDGFAVFDRDWRYVHVNEAAERFYGRSREQLIGRNVWELYPRAIGSELERRMRRAALERTPLELELVSPQFGRWIRYRFFPYERGLAMFFRDVDEEHRLRSAVRESEERHRSMFEHSLLGWMLVAPDGRVFSANPAASRLLQRSEEDIAREGWHAIVNREDPRLKSAIATLRHTGRIHGELEMVRGDGTRFPAMVSAATFRDADGEERASLSFDDVSERRRAEDALACLAEAGAVLTRSLDVEETLQALAAFIVPRLADCCAIEILENAHPRCAIAKHRDGERDLADLCSSPWPVAVEEVLRTGETMRVERVDEAWLAWATAGDPDTLARARACEAHSMVVAPLVVRDRALGAMVLAFVDDMQRYEETAVGLTRSLADRAALAVDHARQHRAEIQAKRLRDEVLGFVAHDLRSPLQSIAMSADLLAEEADGRAVGTIKRAVARANRLIDDLLAAAMLEGGALPVERREEPLDALVREVIELHRPIAETRAIALTAHVPEGAGDASMDRHRVVQLLSNLVANALKFTPAGGSVDIDVDPGVDAVEIRVRDTGCGIAPDDVPHIFDRLWQSRHQRRGGAGLGLAIAWGIADAHGGRLHVESELDHGTTFRLVLPRRDPEAAAVEPRGAEAAS